MHFFRLMMMGPLFFSRFFPTIWMLTNCFHIWYLPTSRTKNSYCQCLTGCRRRQRRVRHRGVVRRRREILRVLGVILCKLHGDFTFFCIVLLGRNISRYYYYYIFMAHSTFKVYLYRIFSCVNCTVMLHRDHFNYCYQGYTLPRIHGYSLEDLEGVS